MEYTTEQINKALNKLLTLMSTVKYENDETSQLECLQRLVAAKLNYEMHNAFTEEQIADIEFTFIGVYDKYLNEE